MANSIENKVVEMTFDNARFEQNISKTLSSLDKLKTALNFGKTKTGFSDIQAQADKFNTNNIQRNIDGVRSKFSQLEGDMGKVKSSLNIDTSKTGFAELQAQAAGFNTSHVTEQMANVKGSFTDLQASANTFDASAISRGIEGVSAKFAAMATIGITALSRLTNMAITSGLSFVKSFSFGPIMDGFQEFQTNTGAIQTILANTSRFGTKLPEVTSALDQLNTYSDKTIYNFGEMVKNISLFTNAGINIQDATSDIKGFSNAAAASGVSAEGAAGAAYQLSQAMSNGVVKLMDWKSLTNVGLGSANMRDGLLKVANAMGTVQSTGTKTADIQNHFNESLQKGWLTAGVMSSYLKIMSGDLNDANGNLDKAKAKTLGLSDAEITWFSAQQKTAEEAATKVRTFTQLLSTVKESIGSQWSTAFRTVLGDFNEATTLFTGLNNLIGGSISKVGQHMSDMLAGWKAFGGRNLLFADLMKVLSKIKDLIDPIRFALRKLFPPKTAGDLVKGTLAFDRFLDRIKIGPKLIVGIARVFSVFFGTLKLGWTILKGVVKVFTSFFGGLLKGGAKQTGSLLSTIAGALGKFIIAATKFSGSGLNKVAEFAGKLGKALGSLLGKILPTADHIKKLVSVFKSFWKTLSTGKSALKEASKIEEFALKIRAAVAKLKEIGKSVADAFGKIKGVGGKALGGIFDGIVKAFSKVKGLGGNVLGSVFDGIASAFDKVKGLGGNALGGIFDGVANAFNKLKDVSGLDSVIKKITELFDKLKASPKFDFVGPMVTGLIDGFSSGFDKVKSVIMDLAHNIIDWIKGVLGIHSPSTVMEEIGVNIIKGLVKGITLAIAGIGDIFTALAFTIIDSVKKIGDKIGESFGGFKFDNLLKGGLLGALLLVSKAFYNFSKDNPVQALSKAITGVGKGVEGVLKKVGGAVKAFQLQIKAKALKDIAIAMAILAASLFVLSRIPAADLGKALGAVTVGFGQLALMLKAIDRYIHKGGKHLTGVALALIGLAAAMLILAVAVRIMGTLKLTEVAKGVGAVTVLLAGMAGVAKVVSKQKAELIGLAATLIGISAGMVLLGLAVKILGSLKLGDLVKGVTSVVVLMGGLAAAADVLGGKKTELIGVATTILAISVAMIVMSYAIKKMAEMNLGEIARGLVGIAGSMGTMALALKLLDDKEVARKGLAFVLLAYSLQTFAKAVQYFANINFATLGNGLLKIALTLGVMIIAMRLMPNDMTKQVLDMILLAGALILIGKAVQIVGKMKFTEVIKGVLGLAAVLLVLGAVISAMQAEAVGVAALVAAAAALLVVAKALQIVGKMKLGSLITSIVGIAVALLVFGAVAAVLGFVSPLILLFGIAMLALGIGLLAFGAGAYLAANAILLLAKAGKGGLKTFIEMVDSLIGLLPHFITTLVDGIIQGMVEFLAQIPKLAGVLGKAFDAIIKLIIKLVPKLMVLFGKILQGLIGLATKFIPQFALLGVNIVLGIIRGLANSVPKIVTAVGDLITNFINALAGDMKRIIDAGVNLITSFLDGMANAATTISEHVGNLIHAILMAIESFYQDIIDAGTDAVVKFLSGLTADVQKIAKGVGDFVTELIKQFGLLATRIANAGTDALVAFLEAIATDVTRICKAAGDVIHALADCLFHNSLSKLPGAGISALGHFIGGLGQNFGKLLGKGAEAVGKIISGITSRGGELVGKGAGIVRNIINGIISLGGDLVRRGGSIASSIINGITGVLRSGAHLVKEAVDFLVGLIPKWIRDKLKIGSPSKVTQELGGYVVQGFVLGLRDTRGIEGAAGNIVNTLSDALSQIPDMLGNVDDLNPTITPILDLTKVEKEAGKIGKMVSASPLVAGASIDQAHHISSAFVGKATTPEPTVVKEIVSPSFTQINYSPKAIGRPEIYRATKSQIAHAKEELGI